MANIVLISSVQNWRINVRIWCCIVRTSMIRYACELSGQFIFSNKIFSLCALFLGIHTTFTWPTEYSKTIVKTVIANLNEKLCDKSQNIHFSRTASSNIKMELIQINAVKNSSNKIKVRGNADT